MTETEDLRGQLVGALKSRAMLIATLYEELLAEIGAERAEAILARALHTRGAAAGRRFFGRFAPADFAGLQRAFVDFLPDRGRLFELDLRDCGADRAAASGTSGGFDLKFRTCPLKDAWVEAGVAPERLQTLCRISGALDVGTFEGAGFAIRNDTWTVGGEGCCNLQVRPRAAPAAG
ncbi:MAG: L-2-amino-thiazoline-4-carboxylic acid hydrolase [Lautropia sp.]